MTEMLLLEEAVAFSGRCRDREVPREMALGGPVRENEVIATLHFNEAVMKRSMTGCWLDYLLETAEPAGEA